MHHEISVRILDLVIEARIALLLQECGAVCHCLPDQFYNVGFALVVVEPEFLPATGTMGEPLIALINL